MKFFTSDTHIGSTQVLENGDGRPFRELSQMHSVLLANAWKVMTPEDELYHLGNAAMGNFDESIKILASYPGKKFLVPGNRDKVFPKLNTEARMARFKPLYEAAGFTILPLHSEIRLQGDGGEPVTAHLSHLPSSPMTEKKGGDKLSFARPHSNGEWLIHGHGSEEPSNLPREFNVGVEANNWTPVSELEILKQIRRTP